MQVEDVDSEVVEAICDEIRGGDYRDNLRSPTWVGYAISKVMGLGLKPGGIFKGDPLGLAKAKAVYNRLLNEGVLRKEMGEDEQRRPRVFVRCSK
jgi:hypothetical protein